MSKSEDSGSTGWSASFFMQTKEDVAKAVAAAAATAVHSPRPSVVYSCGSQFQKLQRHVSRVLKGFSQPPEVRRRTYNPEVLTSQKRQWASFQLQYLVWYLIQVYMFLLMLLTLVYGVFQQVSTEECNSFLCSCRFLYVSLSLAFSALKLKWLLV